MCHVFWIFRKGRITFDFRGLMPEGSSEHRARVHVQHAEKAKGVALVSNLEGWVEVLTGSYLRSSLFFTICGPILVALPSFHLYWSTLLTLLLLAISPSTHFLVSCFVACVLTVLPWFAVTSAMFSKYLVNV